MSLVTKQKTAPKPADHASGRSHSNVYEVDVSELMGTLWHQKWTILHYVLVFIAIGLFVAFGSRVEYRSEVKLMPELQQGSGLGGLGSLARQFGVGSAQQPSEGIPADLYPGITRSASLMAQLLDYPVYVPGLDREATLFEYFDGYLRDSAVEKSVKYTVLLPFTLIELVQSRSAGPLAMDTRRLRDADKESRLVRLSDRQWDVIDELRSRISAGMDRETGVVSIQVKMPDPDMAADVADQVVQFLKQYIIDYRTEKARRDVIFIGERHDEARGRFEAAQRKLAEFRDENRGSLTALARTREQQLQSEYDLTFNLYNTMAERLEEAQIKLQEDTPIVTVIDPASVPSEKSEPRRGFILVLFTLTGALAGSAKAWFFRNHSSRNNS